MAFISIHTSSDHVKRKLRNVARALSSRVTNEQVIRRVAFLWHGRMVLRTPKRWTGSTRQAWSVQTHQSGSYSGYRVANSSKVMYWLEHGTRPHGPVNAKRLFIPLTKRAAQAGARGVIHANRQWSLNQAFEVRGTRRRPPFVPGVDFVFAKRVKGIKAMRIVLDAKRFMRGTLVAAMKQFIRAVISQA